MKRILFIYYTQSGQLDEIAKNIGAAFINSSDADITFYEIKPLQPFPFPWKKDTFFGAFPESFLQIPCPLNSLPEEVLQQKYDLVILGYQVWFLSPSIPINSFLKSPEAKLILANTPVVTVIGCRNMWVMAQEKIKTLLKSNQAILKGNIALVDRVGNLISVVTIVDWMFSGIKRKYLGIFPLPGVSEKDIKESTQFGEIILNCLRNNDLDHLQEQLVGNGAVKISPYLVSIDKKANIVFGKWATFIHKKTTSRANWLKAFNVYLFLVIWLISPIIYVIHILMYVFSINKFQRESRYYKGI
jgi:hypothetical protein